MAGFTEDNPWAFTCAIIGSVMSGVLRTFYGVYNLKGGIEELTPVPYIISLFNCMLRIYYASINGSGYIVFLIINMFGCFFNAMYIIVYLIYTPKKVKVPNALSLMFGVIQIVIYMMYKHAATEEVTDSLQLAEGHSGTGKGEVIVEMSIVV
ncbi:bidirectional sugar transporter SWEET14-like [Dioscorea cayenensis subsp. rotundata]|uniref:Bidirectional sugar transporter SWEET14-like n=1 Tax=Dioscorea cayennensis subsp. rotundata TaxID=55577 RepID=A0AB40CFY2_DIOCR|nr:bidirectional sugar transporter SWEET14-like [Dioscorea cayenensis subsp. rotundata]